MGSGAQTGGYQVKPVKRARDVPVRLRPRRQRRRDLRLRGGAGTPVEEESMGRAARVGRRRTRERGWVRGRRQGRRTGSGSDHPSGSGHLGRGSGTSRGARVSQSSPQKTVSTSKTHWRVGRQGREEKTSRLTCVAGTGCTTAVACPGVDEAADGVARAPRRFHPASRAARIRRAGETVLPGSAFWHRLRFVRGV